MNQFGILIRKVVGCGTQNCGELIHIGGTINRA
jgi:hypothetical protein